MPLGPCPLLHVADEGAPLSPIRVLASFLSLLHQAVCKHTHHCSGLGQWVYPGEGWADGAII